MHQEDLIAIAIGVAVFVIPFLFYLHKLTEQLNGFICIAFIWNEYTPYASHFDQGIKSPVVVHCHGKSKCSLNRRFSITHAFSLWNLKKFCNFDGSIAQTPVKPSRSTHRAIYDRHKRSSVSRSAPAWSMVVNSGKGRSTDLPPASLETVS